MNIVLLKDLEENNVDAVIVAETSTTEEIKSSIKKMRIDFWAKDEDWEWDDLLECLPKDCTVYDRWGKLGEIYY